MSALAPASNPSACSSPSTRSRPPASRSHAPGNTRRNNAIACSASRGDSMAESASGVPGRGSSRFAGTSYRDDDAELRRSRIPGRAGRGEHLVEVEEGIDVDRGVEANRLRAERAVLGAGTRLGVDEALELHRGAHVREANLVRESDER